MKQTEKSKIRVQGGVSTPTSNPFSRREYVRRAMMRLNYRAERKWRENSTPSASLVPLI